MKQISDFKLKVLEDKLNQAAELLKKNNNKINKAIHVGVISELISFFKHEYPNLNREPLKKLMTDVLETQLINSVKVGESYAKSNKQELKVSRKRKTDCLIVAAIELMIDDGKTELEAIRDAAYILKKKNESNLLKLLKSYRSALLPSHIGDLVRKLKKEGKKRFNSKQSAVVYLERAAQNIK